jgi:hypothetical protein
MLRIDDLVAMVRERRLGFAVDEVMSGYHRFEPGFGSAGRLPMEFRVTWGTKNLRRYLDPKGDRFLVNNLEGSVSIGCLCKDVPCKGTLELKYFSEQAIRYSFVFEIDGKAYHYVGEKVNIWPWNLHVSHTICFGTLVETETGKLVSRSVTRFRLRTFPAFLASFRLA